MSGHNRPWRFVKAIEEWDFDVMMNAVSIVSRHIYNFEEHVWPLAVKKGIGLFGMKVFGGVRESAKSAKGAHLPDELKPLALRYALGLPGLPEWRSACTTWRSCGGHSIGSVRIHPQRPTS